MKFQLEYFKPDSGKWYADGEIDVPATLFYEAISILRGLHRSDKLPGVTHSSGFDVYCRNKISHLLRSKS